MPVAFPLPQRYILDGGTQVVLTLHGDEFLNWYEDDRGNTIVSTRDGYLHYASWDYELARFVPAERLTSASFSDRMNEAAHPLALRPPRPAVRNELHDESLRHYRNPAQIPDPTKPEVCSSCPTSGVCDPACESAHTHSCCSCHSCGVLPACCIHDEEIAEEVAVPDEDFELRPVAKDSIVRPILPIYVRFADDTWSPRLDLPNYYMENHVIAYDKFVSLANYYHKQTRGAVKLVNLGIRYVTLDTPPRNYSQHLDEVYDDIIYPALQKVAMDRGVTFYKYRRCCDKYRPCRIDPTTCTPLFIVHGYELSEGGVGPGVWGHARWGLGRVNVNGTDFDFDTYMVVGAFQQSNISRVLPLPLPLVYTPTESVEEPAEESAESPDESTAESPAESPDDEPPVEYAIPLPEYHELPSSVNVDAVQKPACSCVTFIQTGVLVHEAGHALFYLHDLYGGSGQRAQQQVERVDGIDVVIAVDVSGSMSSELITLENEIGTFTESLASDSTTTCRVGVASYMSSIRVNYLSDGRPFAETPEEAVELATKARSGPFTGISGGAAHATAIMQVLSGYPWAASTRYIILVTDAGNEGGLPLADAAAACESEGVSVVTVVTASFKDYFTILRGAAGDENYVELTPSDSVWGMELSTKVVETILESVGVDRALSDGIGFGMWSPMGHGSWGMNADYPVPGEIPSNLDAYSLYQIQPRLTVPQWSSSEKVISDPYTPHSMVLRGDPDSTITHETFLLQFRNYTEYDEGVLGFWKVSGFLNFDDAEDRARIKPGIMVIHDWNRRRTFLRDSPRFLPAYVAEAHGLISHLRVTTDERYANHGDTEDLFGSGRDAFGDSVEDPDDKMISVRKDELAGFDAVSMSASAGHAVYSLGINSMPPTEWNDMSKWPDDLLKPDVPPDNVVNTWCYFGKHFQCGSQHYGHRQIYRDTSGS